jgi:Domain of Unknown Function (DUF1206)
MAHGLGTAQSNVGKVGREAAEAADSTWVHWLGRAGLIARGVVYLVIGGLALQIALGQSTSNQANQKGAFAAIADKPFGAAMLWLMVIGLLGYALWQAIDAIAGLHAYQGRERTGKRIESATKAVIYVALAVSAARIAMGSSSQSQGGEGITAKVLGMPGGQWWVGLAGVGIAAAGCVQFWRALQRDHEKRMDLYRLSDPARSAVQRLGQVGYLSRAVVFAIFGVLVISAALNYDPSKAHGLDVALRELADKPFGSFLLGVVAVGLICFGAFSFVESRYRRRA